MNYSSSNFSSSKRGFPAGNPIANALVIIVGALAIGASIVLGFFTFVILASLLLVFSAIIGIRLWWFNRKWNKSQRESENRPTADKASVTYIEGEYHVVHEQRDEQGSADKS